MSSYQVLKDNDKSQKATVVDHKFVSNHASKDLFCSACFRHVYDESTLTITKDALDVCPHWKYRVHVQKSDSLFGSSMITHEFKSLCCSLTHFRKSTERVSVTCKCGLLQVGAFLYEWKYLFWRDRDFCGRCSKRGVINEHSFRKCTNCEGTSGLSLSCVAPASPLSITYFMSDHTKCQDCLNGVVASKLKPSRECPSCVPNFLDFARQYKKGSAIVPSE